MSYTLSSIVKQWLSRSGCDKTYRSICKNLGIDVNVDVVDDDVFWIQVEYLSGTILGYVEIYPGMRFQTLIKDIYDLLPPLLYEGEHNIFVDGVELTNWDQIIDSNTTLYVLPSSSTNMIEHRVYFKKYTDNTGITSIVCSSDGETMAVVNASGELEILKFNCHLSQIDLSSLNVESCFLFCFFTPDDILIAGGITGIHAFYSPDEHEIILDDYILSAALSPDGKYLAIGYWNNTISIMSMKTREIICKFEEKEFLIYEGGRWNSLLSFISDDMLVVGFTDKNEVIILSVENCKVLRKLDNSEKQLTSVELSPDGKFLVTHYLDKINIWSVGDDASSIKLKTTLCDNTDTTPVAFSPDSKSLAFRTCDNKTKLLSLEDQRVSHTFDHPDMIFSMNFLSNDTLICGTVNETLIFQKL